MGCNCNKRKAAQQRRTYSPTNATRPQVRSAATSGGLTASAATFSVIYRDGTKETYGSRLEADAANARAGYTGVIKRG